MFGIFKRPVRNEPESDPVARVKAHLAAMGYELTPYGAMVALLECKSGYSEAEAASHIALTTMARDIKEAPLDARWSARLAIHARILLDMLKEYKDSGLMHPAQWQNDSTAFWRIVVVDEHQHEWIDKILFEPVTGKERLATCTIDYRVDD